MIDRIIATSRITLAGSLFLAASQAIAQNTYFAEKPQYYSWQLCPDPNDPVTPGYVHESRFAAMLHIGLRPQGESYPAITTPSLAAEATVSKLLQRIAEENIDLDRIGITFQNFGGKRPGERICRQRLLVSSRRRRS